MSLAVERGSGDEGGRKGVGREERGGVVAQVAESCRRCPRGKVGL